MAKTVDVRSKSPSGLPFAGTETSRDYFHQDAVTGEITLENVSDITELVETNRALVNDLDERTPWRTGGAGLNRVASIPMALFMQLKREGIVDDKVALRKWLNDYDNRVFRTRPGVV